MTSSEIVVGGIDSATLQNAVSLNRNSIVSTAITSRPDRFWASQPRYADSEIKEVLEIDYASTGITNSITLDVSHYPHTLTIEYSPDNGDHWQSLLDPVTNQPLTVETLNSFPPVLADPSTIIGHFHPQHDYQGHWITLNLKCAVAQVQRLRFILQRNGGTGPVDILGNPVPYSLALQNIDTGYTIESENDIPFFLDEVASDTSGEVFANSADLLGSNLGFSKKTYKASNLVYNTDDDAPLIWKSEPQPFSNAVVNFYADLRDPSGAPQTIDQIFIDPIYLGCSVNLYYSNDDTSGSFLSPRKGLSSDQVVYAGASVSKNGPLDLGVWHSATTDENGDPVPAFFDPFYAQIDNLGLGFDPSIDWWIGIVWTRPYDKATDALDHDLFSCGQFRIGSNSDNFYLKTDAGDDLLLPNLTVQDEPIKIVAASRNGSLHLTVIQGDDDTIYTESDDDDGIIQNSIDVPLSLAFSSTIPFTLQIGANDTLDTFADGTIDSFILSQSTLITDDFISDPSAYSTVPLIASDEDKAKYNALIRLDTSYLSANNVVGLIGGPAYPYDSMTWTPIPRTYEMQRGIMRLPTTKAKFWNLEISNLRPASSEKFVPVTRTIKTFPPELYPPTTQLTSGTTRQSPDDIGINTQIDVSSNLTFTDIPQFVGTGQPLSGITNTQVYVADDHNVQQQLADTGNAWKYQQFHPNKRSVRFGTKCVHNYVTSVIKQTTNVSFFAGLRQIVFGLTARSSPQDLPVITDDFVDPQTIKSGNWQLTDQGLISSPSDGGVVFSQSTSIVLPTQTGLRGLQFAAQQSDARAIDIKGDFDNPAYIPSDVDSWTPWGDGKPFGLIYNPITNSYAFMVSRNSQEGFWGDITLNYGPTYADIEITQLDDGTTRPTTYADLAAGLAFRSAVGGIVSETIQAPIGGQIHAAARVTASEALSEPLYVQIVDADTGGVLAEAQSNVSKNEVKQWYASFDLNDLGAEIGNTYGDLIGNAVWPSYTDDFTRANQTGLSRMDTGQLWNTPEGMTPFNISSDKATSPSAGARSEIDTETPWGTLAVKIDTLTTTATHSAAVPVIDLGDIFLMNDGTYMSNNESATLGTAGIAAGSLTTNRLNFQFMPTSQVPVGQLPAGIDVVNQPYSIVISTGTSTLTWVQTISSSHEFNTVRAITGPSGTQFSHFSWVPSTTQVAQGKYIPSGFYPDPSSLVDDGGNVYTYTHNGRIYTLQGQYTLSSTGQAGSVALASLRPGGSYVVPPTGVTATPSTTGGIFTAGTYYYEVSAVNEFGETRGSTPAVSAAVIANGIITVNWTAAAGATDYNVYRSTSSSGPFYFVGNSSGTTSMVDVGDVADTTRTAPPFNATDGAGSLMVTDVGEDYGFLRFNVLQVPNDQVASNVPIAVLDYDPSNDIYVTLQANGDIYDQIGNTVLESAALGGAFNPVSGPITVYFADTRILSSAFLGSHTFANPTAILFFQNNTYLGSYSTAGSTWSSTVRGIAGANNGVAAATYTIIEGFNWSTNAAVLASVGGDITWGEISWNHTRTYGQMSDMTLGSTQNLNVRIVQKNFTNDSWFIQSAELFWDPVIWEFSCDGGKTWWEASDIRNDPNGVLLFPLGLSSYDRLRWRVTSYSGRVFLSHLAIRPWYVGKHGYTVPFPSNLPKGPNVIPSDDYGPIERDPRWMGWDKPVPHWWWNEGVGFG